MKTPASSTGDSSGKPYFSPTYIHRQDDKGKQESNDVVCQPVNALYEAYHFAPEFAVGSHSKQVSWQGPQPLQHSHRVTILCMHCHACSTCTSWTDRDQPRPLCGATALIWKAHAFCLVPIGPRHIRINFCCNVQPASNASLTFHPPVAGCSVPFCYDSHVRLLMMQAMHMQGLKWESEVFAW